jgi:hypothetical protein
MPEQIQVPPPPTSPRTVRSEPSDSYELRHTFPSKPESRQYAAGVFYRAPTRNPGFIGLLGTAQLLFMLSLVGLFAHTSPLTRKWLELPIALTVLLFLGGGIAFAKSPTGGPGKNVRRITLGLLHSVAHLALGVGATWLLWQTSWLRSDWPLPILVGIGYLLLVGAVAALIFCAYLLVAARFGVNVNELFSAQSIIDSKSFLRLHIDSTGALTVYPIEVPTVGRKWTPNPGAADPHASWLDPATPIGYRLTEPPIVVR